MKYTQNHSKNTKTDEELYKKGVMTDGVLSTE